MADVATGKRCRTCGETKPLDAFHAHPESRDGRNGACAECCREAQRRRVRERRARRLGASPQASAEWRAIPSTGGRYEASSEGEVRRAAAGQGTWGGRVIKPRVGTHDYLEVTIHPGTTEGSRKVCVHELVAEAFHGPRPAGLYVNHLDLDKRNNRPGNLEYVTPRENTHHALRARGWVGA